MSQTPLSLVLSVKARNWRQNDDTSESADTAFKNIRKKALDRDDNTCRFCGFRASSYQEVHHVNDDHSDNRLDNLVTACLFCHMCHHIGRAGVVNEGSIIYLPQISQAHLNHLVRSCLVAQRWAEPYVTNARHGAPTLIQQAKFVADAAKSLMSALRAQEAEAVRLIGTSSATVLGEALMMIATSGSSEAYEKRDQYLNGLRLLPSGTRFIGGSDAMPKIIDTWLATGGPYAQLSPTMWPGLFITAGAR